MDGIVQAAKGPVVALEWLLGRTLARGWLALPILPIVSGFRALRRAPSAPRSEAVLPANSVM